MFNLSLLFFPHRLGSPFLKGILQSIVEENADHPTFSLVLTAYQPLRGPLVLSDLFTYSIDISCILSNDYRKYELFLF